MQSLEDVSKQIGMDVVMVPVDAVEYQEGNPNALDSATYEALKAEIRDQGFIQPIVVREVSPDRFMMIDGEHRHQIVKELGFEGIPAVVIDADDDEARIRLLTANKLRGQFVPIRLAIMLADLVQRIPEKELRRRLGMDETEMRDTLKLADFTDDATETLREQVRKEAEEAPVAVRFVLSHRDAEVVERVVSAVADGKTDRGQALAKVCRAYEKTHKIERKDKPDE